jgi:DNA-binding GntR family transcriptional regulator
MPLNYKYKSLKELVYEYLYERINSGSIKANEKINENHICQDLHVSRTPVREALIQLEDEGYIQRIPRRGFIVREVTLNKIKEIYEIIGCLEGLAAALAIDKMTGKDIILLDTLVDKMDEAIKNRKLHEYFRLQRNFHNVYISASGNEELHNMLVLLKKRFVKKAYFTHENDQELYNALKDFNSGHKQIVRLIKNSDKKGVAEYLKEMHWNYKNAEIVVSPFESS